MDTGLSKGQMKICRVTAFILVFIGCFWAILSHASENQEIMKIRVEANGQSIVYKLNDSTAAKELYAQLPLSIKVEDYGGLEKIFYPPQKLSTTDAPLVSKAENGTLAYYAPWGDVVMFYEKFGSAAGLYELGEAISGKHQIERLAGSLRITQEK